MGSGDPGCELLVGRRSFSVPQHRAQRFDVGRTVIVNAVSRTGAVRSRCRVVEERVQVSSRCSVLVLLACCGHVIIVIETRWVRNGATKLGLVKECGEGWRTTRGGAPNATNSDGLVTVATR